MLSFLFIPSNAHALKSSLSTEFFKPTVDNANFFSFYNSTILKKGSCHLGGWSIFAHHPLQKLQTEKNSDGEFPIGIRQRKVPKEAKMEHFTVCLHGGILKINLPAQNLPESELPLLYKDKALPAEGPQGPPGREYQSCWNLSDESEWADLLK